MIRQPWNGQSDLLKGKLVLIWAAVNDCMGMHYIDVRFLSYLCICLRFDLNVKIAMSRHVMSGEPLA